MMRLGIVEKGLLAIGWDAAAAREATTMYRIP
jgi:hypothetical protein